MAERIDGIRRLKKTAEKEDRLSALPDSLIHHILSLLPSTKGAIRTGILSKRWRNQWTFVSNLFFDFTAMPYGSRKGVPSYTHTISRIVEQTLFLHQCSKLQKFQIITDQFHEHDPNSEDKIGFAVRKNVEELILEFSDRKQLRLPEFFFSQPPLVKLKICWCSFELMAIVNWKSLKDLCIENCSCTCEVITNIVSSCPLLQSLELKDCLGGHVTLVIASKSLKRLVLFGYSADISCPNLLEFVGRGVSIRYQNLGNKVLEKLISGSPLLESLELDYFEFTNVRIASRILKKLVVKGWGIKEIEISCPRLEELGLSGRFETLRLMNLSSSVCAFLDLHYKATIVKEILDSVQHLNELKFGNFFLESLSAPEMDFISHPLLKCKSLTLQGSYWYGLRDFKHIPGIAYALRSSPLLERIVVKLEPFKYLQHLGDLSGLDHSEENYWHSNETHLSNLVSHLRTVEITGFSLRLSKPKHVLDFVEFLLKSASALEKMVIILEDCGTDFVIKASQKLLSFPRCSAAIIELSCPKNM